jgi:hypothetical protein
VAHIRWSEPPFNFLDIKLQRPPDEPYGHSAGNFAGTQIFTDEESALRDIWLSLDDVAKPSLDKDFDLISQFSRAEMNLAEIAANAAPARIVFRSFGLLMAREVALLKDCVSVAFVLPAPWDTVSLSHFQIVKFTEGVFVGIDQESSALAFVTVQLSGSLSERAEAIGAQGGNVG